jgi:hypothetical protein
MALLMPSSTDAGNVLKVKIIPPSYVVRKSLNSPIGNAIN